MDTVDIRLDDNSFKKFQEYAPKKLNKIVRGEEKLLIPWLSADKDDIKGEYDFKIEIGSTLPIDSDRRKQESVGVYDRLTQNPLINQDELLKVFLDAFPNIDTALLVRDIKEVQQERQQAAQAAQEAAMMPEKLKRETDIQKTQMKSQTALAVQKSKNEAEALKETLKGLLK